MHLNMYLDGNLDWLKRNNAPVAAWLSASGLGPGHLAGKLFVNRLGLLDWRRDLGGGLYEVLPPAMVHADWRPERKGLGGTTIIIGAGLGYGPNHVLGGTPNGHKVIVIEPRPEMLLACLGQTDYRPFLDIGKLSFLPPDPELIENEVKRLDVSFLFARIDVHADLALKQLGPEYDRLNAFVKQKLENFSVELSTLRQMQEVMVENELGNYLRAMSEGSLLALDGRGAGLGAVIIGAGPSLSRMAPELKARRGDALYACALQTLPVLERHGLKPDLCLAIDFRPDMIRSIENLADPAFAADVPLLYSTKMDPKVVAAYPGPTMPLWTKGGLGTYALSGHELVLDAGINVGVTLFRFLSHLGVTRFLLAGQDFAWAGTQTHADGHHVAQNVYIPQKGRDVALKNLDNETIYTNLGYLSAKRDLESDIARTGAEVHNLYGGGAPIAGAAVVAPEDLDRLGLLRSSSPGAKDRFLSALGRAREPRVRPIFTPHAADWASSLKNASRRLDKLFRKPAKNQTEIRDMVAKLHFFVRQDPLYLPYLYNEVMDLAGLLATRARYGRDEYAELRAILDRVLKKTADMDVVLTKRPEGLSAPPAATPTTPRRSSKNRGRRAAA